MHHFSSGPHKATYSSDMSGDVYLTNSTGHRIYISGQFLLDLVAHYVANERIAKLEQATTKEILGL